MSPTEPTKIAGWIQDLADARARVRIDAFRNLRNQGLALCAGALGSWKRDPGFCELLCRVSHSLPDADSNDDSIVVGIAVTPERFERIRTANGSPNLSSVPSNQDASEYELNFPGDLNFDILTTRDLAGPGAIARFLRKFGEGIQQIEVYVRNVDRATEILLTRFAIMPIYPTTQSGAEGSRVNFFLVPAADGKKVLVERVEPAG